MSETGDTGQELPVKLPEKATDADVEDKSTTDAEQKPGKEAGEMAELATANTTDKHSAISDADQKEDLREDEKDSLTSTKATDENQETTSHAEEIEETASDDEKGATAFAHLKKASVAVADEKKAPTVFAEKKEQSAVVEEKKELAAVADEKRATKAFADEKQKLAAVADEKQKLAAVADEKKAPTAVPDVKNGPTAVAEEKKVSAAVAYVNKASTTFADEKSAPTAVAEAKKESAAGAYEMKAPTTFANEKKESTAAVVDKMKESTAVEDEKQEKEEDFLDILGNGTLLKKVLEAGSGSRPSMGDEVIVQVSQEIPEIGKTFPEEQLQYVLGDGDVVNALDLVVALMKIGEKTRVITGYKYMYGDLGLEPDIPPRSNFMLVVKLIANNGPLDYTTMEFGRRFAEGLKKKERGNFLFRRKEFSLALNSYSKAGRIVDPSIGPMYNDESAESLQKLLEFRAIILCNSSAAQLKMEAYDAAARSASEAVKLLPSHHKAYIRLGQAQEKLGQTDRTIRNYKLALKYDPDNSKWLHGELERLTKKDKKSKMNQQEMYSKMFWGSSPPPVNITEDTPQGASMSSWLWNTGAAVIGAGLVGLAGIGIYKYLNH